MNTLLDADQLVDKVRRSLAEDAYAALKHAIQDSTFPPGFQASEQEIAGRLGMSRTPVHEAIIRLQEDGLVNVLSKRGVLIIPFSLDDICNIYNVIIALEAMAAELLAGLTSVISSDAYDVLSGEITKMDETWRLQNLKGWAEANDRFHQLVVEGCRNGHLQRAWEIASNQACRARKMTFAFRQNLNHSAQDHRQLMIALLQGDAAAAGLRAREHRLEERNDVLNLLEKIGIQSI